MKSSTTASLSAPQTVHYSYVVTNTGNVTLTGIALSDDNDNNDLSCPPTTLAPTASMTCTATHTFTQAELDANGSPAAGSGKLANTVTATSNQASPETDNLAIQIVQTPKLTLAKSAFPTTYDHVGELITYTYTVTNTGNVTLPGPFSVTDNKVTVDVPAGRVAGARGVAHVHGEPFGDAGRPRRRPDRERRIGVERGRDLAAPDGDDRRRRATVSFRREDVDDGALSAPQTVTYSYLVTNTGNVTVTGISLADNNVSGPSPARSRPSLPPRR